MRHGPDRPRVDRQYGDARHVGAGQAGRTTATAATEHADSGPRPCTPSTPTAGRAPKRSSSQAEADGQGDDATTPRKTIRPSASRTATPLREEAQREQAGLETSGSDELMNMMRQLIMQTTAHLMATDEKLDGIGGRLVPNEVRIAHIEEKLDEHENYMTNRLDQHGKQAKERLWQQGNHIMHMGQEHGTYHITVLARLQDFGKTQQVIQVQIAEQRKQHEQEKKMTDRKIAELQRGLKEAKEVTEARQRSQAGTDAPGEMTLRVAGLLRDTPADEIEKVARKHVGLTTTGKQQMNEAAAAASGDFRRYSPFLLS